MTQPLSVTEVRNALRCPRVFALGRLRGQQVSFPVGASALGSAFHRIVESFARRIEDPPAAVRRLGESSPPEALAAALSGWLLSILASEIEERPAYASMPAEVDDLAEALRQFAAYLASRARTEGVPPANALASFLASAELPVETILEVAGTPIRVSGRIDALHAPPGGAVEVVEYKLTDDANEDVDRAQVALYRVLLGRARGIDATPVILRFNPALTTTRLAPATADAAVERRLLPLLRDMTRWADEPRTAPATRRTDLCPACPLRVDCAHTYPERLVARDEPPSGAVRPRPAATGELEPAALSDVPATAPPPPAPDEAGLREATALRERILSVLREQAVGSPVSKSPLVGARLVEVEVSVSRGRVGAIDRAAGDVIHRLHAEDGQEASYVRRGGLRLFSVARRAGRAVALGALIAARAEWLRERTGRYVLGEAMNGSVLCGDLSDPSACHLLIGGATGSGKSVLLRSLAASLAHFHSPDRIRFTLVDPKRVSFAGLAVGLAAHLAGPLCHEVEEAIPMLTGLVEEMEDRYRQLADDKVQEIADFNHRRPDGQKLPLHVVMVDEFQDLLVSKDTREPFLAAVRRLGAKARAAGIHLVLATQRPTRDNVPGSIKANLQGKIALKVTSALESRVILDEPGAESLLGRGDLLANLGSGLVRAQAPIG